MEANENQLNEGAEEKPLTGDPRKDIVIYGESTRFGKQHQPSPEAKRKGWLKKNRNRKLAQLILSKAFRGKVLNSKGEIVDTKFKSVLKEFFGLDEDEMADMTNEAAIMFRMVGQAVTEGDTAAAAHLLERAYGKPKELTPFDDPDAEDDSGNKPQFVIQIIQQADVPQIKEEEIDDEPTDI